MYFETATSVYKWTTHDGRHYLEKIAVKAGKSSALPSGVIWDGDRVEIIRGELFLYQGEIFVIKTSSIKF